MNKLFFVIGMRRSGTSILRTLLEKHPKIAKVDFEPHPLWNAVDLVHFKRFENYQGVQKTLEDFRQRGGGDEWHGAKFALNPGVKALEWVWLPKTFEGARIIFITRNPEDTYQSYFKQDYQSVRGVLPKEIYMPSWHFIVGGFRHYAAKNPDTTCFVDFDVLLEYPDEQMSKCWRLLELDHIDGISDYIKPPEFQSTK